MIKLLKILFIVKYLNPRCNKKSVFNQKRGSDVSIWNYVVICDNKKIGDGTSIGSFCNIGKNAILGKNYNIQAHVTISNGCVICNNVFIAPNSSLLNDKYPKSTFMRPPTINDDVAIGGGVTILPDVTIDHKAVIGGGSVVTKNVSPRTVLSGVPERVALTLEEYDAKRKAFMKEREKVYE